MTADTHTGPPERRGLSRRRFVGGAAAAGGALVFSGAAPSSALAADAVTDAFQGLAAFVTPGNDEYSKHQGVSTNRPGGVANGAADVTRESLRKGLPIVIGEIQFKAPGDLGFEIILRHFSQQVSFWSVFGPFSSPFANLSWERKRRVLELIDREPLLQNNAITYAGNALATLAALGGFSEGRFYDQKAGRLTGDPVGYQLSQYQGVSDGHDAFLGYYQGRTEVSG